MSHRPTIVPRIGIGLPHRALLAGVALVSLTLAACSDQPVAPAMSSPSGVAASNDRFDVNSATATLEWEATARRLVIAHTTFNPLVAGRAYALLGVGQYGAVVESDAADPVAGGRALYEARRGAVAGASATILSYLFPDSAAAIEDQLANDGAAGAGGTHPHFTRGVATGRAMGARMIDWARRDGFSLVWDGQPFPDALGGGWVGAAGAPAGYQFPTMKPYYLVGQSQFRPAPPIARGTPEFETDLQAVRDAMNARTSVDSASAIDWNLNTGTITALGYWDERAADYIPAHALDERDASHVFALMNSAALDALIGCWDAKYYYMRLRPSMADATITRVKGPPSIPYGLPNHPSYPSGHSCVSASAARVLASFFPEHAATLDGLVSDAGRSRVIGGIHFPSDVTVGQALGRTVADWAMAYDHQPGGLLRALDNR
jgi:membrane-associated phospholipid phosphatase